MATALYLDENGLVPLALLACGLHECGHLVTLWCMRGRLKALKLTATGAEMIVSGVESPYATIILALAGPATNMVVAGITTEYFNEPIFVGLNLILAVLNMVPLSPLDGGRAFYAMVCLLSWENKASDMQNVLDCCLMCGLCILGVIVLVVGGSFTLLILAIWMLWSRKKAKFHKNTCK